MTWVVAGVVLWLVVMNTVLVWRVLSLPRAAAPRPTPLLGEDVQKVTEYLHGDTDELPGMPVGFDG